MSPYAIPSRASIEPFEVPYSDEHVDDLRRRLSATRWPDEIVGSNWQYGVELGYLREFCVYWKEQFDWQAHVERLRKLSHFTFQHEDLRVHFVHAKGQGSKPIPLVITHGWPGSFLEMLKLIPLLTAADAEGRCFDVVIPSLPGFGYSDKPHLPGMHTERIATIWAELMRALGYERFAAQGGDFGAGVTTFLGLRHSDRVLGVHLNYIPGSYMPDLTSGSAPTSEEQAFLDYCTRWDEENGAYAHVQTKEPQTIGCALNDSPMGLAAWILEKFRLWAECDGDLSKRFTKDELLENVMLYWTTQTITSSCRLYLEMRNHPAHFGRGERVTVPCAIARFPFESPFPPRSWVERGYNVQRWTDMPSGGHFAAMEEPELLARDIREFFLR